MSSGSPARNGTSVEPGLENIVVSPRRRNASNAASRTVVTRRLAPDFLRDLDDQPQLRPLVVFRQAVALDGRREAALRRQAELLERCVARRLLEPALQLVLRLQLAALRRHESEDDLLLSLRQEAQ